MLFGAHVSIGGGIFHAPENGKKASCDVVQIFTKNQMQWRVPELTEEDIEKFKQAERNTGVKVVCVHASYLINLGSFESEKLRKSRENLTIELIRAQKLGIPYVIVHPGSHGGRGIKAGIKRIAESLNWVLEQTHDLNTIILLETTAGQGDNLGYTFEQLAEIKVKVEQPERIAVCVDTCHVFAAGYELRNIEGYQQTMRLLDETLGLDQVKIIHTNDSKRELGSRVDRHAHIGEGELGLQAFRYLVNDEHFKHVPKIIETPGGPQKDAENLGKLRSLVNLPDKEL